MKARGSAVVRWMWLWGPLLTLLVFGGPTLVLHVVARDAEQCFASIPRRTEAALPDCTQRAHWLDALTQLPFVGRPAQRVQEEIAARMAVWRYVDAAVGQPDREQLTLHVDALQPAAAAIEEGSTRLRMDDVGPPMPVPEPGALAHTTGDRFTLDQRGLQWSRHYTETRALEAVLLEGRLERAVRLAQHYQGRPNEDLRVRVAALLCAGGHYPQGIDQLLDVEVARASERTANFTRSFGGVRVVHEACVHGAKLVAAPVPAHGQAGAWDERERLMSMRMRHLRATFPSCDFSDPLACRADPRVSADLDGVRELLRSESISRHRLALFASIADAITSADVAQTYAAPRPGEPTLAEQLPHYADEWVAHVDGAPFVPAERYESSAAHLAELGDVQPIADIIQALFVRAAVGYAVRSDLGAADRCIVRAGLDGAPLVLMRANAALVAGDRAEARRRVAVEAPRHPRLLVLQAALALPDTKLARAQASEALAQGEDALVIERARWLLAALGVPTQGNQVLTRAPEPPPRYRFSSWQDGITSEAVRTRNVDDTLAMWHHWLGSDNRLEARYEAFQQRGDAPAGMAPWLFAGARLSSPHFTSDQTEMWLDALMAFDARRFSLRQVAFARWQAATWRSDAAAAAVWHARYRKLADLSQDPQLADLLHALRI